MNEVIQIRQAQVNDIDELTRLHCDSFQPEDHIPVMLGPGYVKASYKWLTTSSSAYVLVAEVEKKIVGLVAVCDKPFTIPMFLSCFGELLFSLIKKPALLINKRLWKRMFRHSETSKGGEKFTHYPGFAQMTIGAVDSNYRGLAIFPALVNATADVSQSRGSRAIQVGVYKINNSSRRVFIKGGWIETPELETDETVFYVNYLDPEFPKEIGISLPQVTKVKSGEKDKEIH